MSDMILANILDTNTANNLRQLEQKLRALKKQIQYKLEAFSISPSNYDKNYEQHLGELENEVDQSIGAIINLMNFVVRDREVINEYKRSHKADIDNYIHQIAQDLERLTELQKEFK